MRGFDPDLCHGPGIPEYRNGEVPVFHAALHDDFNGCVGFVFLIEQGISYDSVVFFDPS
jgi:hypothetical protein